MKPNYLEEATSMGAAIIGGVGCGAFKSFDVADRFIQITDRVQPDPANADVYREAKALLTDGYCALAGLFPRLGKKRAAK